MIGQHLKENKIYSGTKIYNKPKYVYIPLVNGKNKDVITLVKKGEYVYKEMPIAKVKGNNLPILSSVSGIVVDIEKHMIFDGTLCDTVKIENDFKETIEKTKKIEENINKYSKEDFIEILRESAIIGMGGSSFPTYLKYKSEINTLIVNAVECEPFISTDYEITKTKIEEILICIDAIMEINNIDNCYIAIKKNKKELIKIINNYIGTYPKIKLSLIPVLYPMGWERYLVEYITGKKYKSIPSEVGIIVNNISTIYAMYDALKYQKPLIERSITITGDMVKEKTNVIVKNGTKLDEILEFVGLKRNEEVVAICGGPMMGTSVTEDLVITPNVNAIIVNKKIDIEEEKVCLRCSKCSLACPARIEPGLIKDYKDNKEMLKKLNVNKCIECGICSYVCPAKINVREYVRKAKENYNEKV